MKNPCSNSKLKRRSAFTLIEIMVATVIMVILVGLVIQITSEVLKVWNRSSGKLSANAEARIALDLLTQDLETAVFRNDGLEWLRAEDDVLEGPDGEQTATVALSLFSPALDRDLDSSGDICGIAYSLDYNNAIDGTSSGDQSFVLYRMLVEPEQTFDELMGEDYQYDLPGEGSTSWLTAGTLKGDDGDNYLVSNIVKFELDFYVADDGDSSTPTLVPGNTIFGGTDATVGAGAANAEADYYKYPLSYAVIKLTIVSDQGMDLLRNLDKISLTFDEILEQHAEVFTRRVNFLARPM
jgi:prepilin-type N-terminal cleavage/methylation domain-containing protein